MTRTGLLPLFTFHLSPFTSPASLTVGRWLLIIGYSRSAMYRSRLRLIGLILLVLGLATGEGIYWFGEKAAEKAGTQQSDELANSIQLENQRKADREIEMGFGKVYVMVIYAEDWWAVLPAYKQVAFLLAAATVIAAGSCFILAAQLRQ
jgi:hypothetical protein